MDESFGIMKNVLFLSLIAVNWTFFSNLIGPALTFWSENECKKSVDMWKCDRESDIQLSHTGLKIDERFKSAMAINILNENEKWAHRICKIFHVNFFWGGR